MGNVNFLHPRNSYSLGNGNTTTLALGSPDLGNGPQQLSQLNPSATGATIGLTKSRVSLQPSSRLAGTSGTSIAKADANRLEAAMPTKSNSWLTMLQWALKYGKQYKIPPEILAGMAFKESTVNFSASAGLMQADGDAAARVHIGGDHLNPENQVKIAAASLNLFRKQSNGNLDTAIKKYNCGPYCADLSVSNGYLKMVKAYASQIRSIIPAIVPQDNSSVANAN